jgi:uncharacterized protein YdhG (YjbR/CyaY superfamily)
MDDDTKPASIDAYLLTVTPEAKAILSTIRELIGRNVPDAEETISYQMPAFRRTRIFIYFAAFRKHIGIYPPLKHDAALIEELRPYSNAKGNLQFPLNQPIPYQLIGRLAVALAQERGGAMLTVSSNNKGGSL